MKVTKLNGNGRLNGSAINLDSKPANDHREYLAALKTVCGGHSVALPLKVKLSPWQWFNMQSIATAESKTLDQVFAEYFDLDDTKLINASGGSYAEPDGRGM